MIPSYYWKQIRLFLCCRTVNNYQSSNLICDRVLASTRLYTTHSLLILKPSSASVFTLFFWKLFWLPGKSSSPPIPSYFTYNHPMEPVETVQISICVNGNDLIWWLQTQCWKLHRRWKKTFPELFNMQALVTITISEKQNYSQESISFGES